MTNQISRKLYDKVRQSHRKGMKVSDICKQYRLDTETVKMILTEDFENL